MFIMPINGKSALTANPHSAGGSASHVRHLSQPQVRNLQELNELENFITMNQSELAMPLDNSA